MEKIASTLEHFRLPDFPPEYFAEVERKRKEEDERVARQELLHRLNAANIPKRYDDAEIENCIQPIIDYAADIEAGGTSWLVLTGLNGRGKTYAAVSVLKAAIHAGRRGLYTKTKTILDDVSNTYSSHTETEREVISRYVGRDVLVIDDLGKENTTDWSTPILFEVIDGRYERSKATIFTTNLNANQLIYHLSKGGSSLMAESIVSRMADSIRIRMDGEDRRLK